MQKSEVSFSTRRRVLLIQMLYAISMNSHGIEDLNEKEIERILLNASVASRYKTDDNLPDVMILMKILQNLTEIDEVVEKNCKTSSRLSKVVLSILRVGSYELKYCEHKHTVGNIIKDYLNIAVAFDHDVEVGFINGILDKVYGN
jgi:transcription termination factor NusB